MVDFEEIGRLNARLQKMLWELNWHRMPEGEFSRHRNLIREAWTHSGNNGNTAELLAGSRLLCDAYDRIGDYDSSAEALAGCDNHFGELDSLDLSSDQRLLTELLWALLMRSVVEHRAGEYGAASDHARRVIAAIDKIDDGPHADELGFRALYALGRHHQSQGQAASAEEYFTEALEACVRARRPRQSDGGTPSKELDVAEQSWERYRRYQAAVVLVALGRAHADQGQLTRAWRVILVSEILLGDSGDQAMRGFVEYLRGLVQRQRQRLDDAVRSLKKALAEFSDLKHERFFLRAQHELAKAQYNQALDGFKGALEDADKTLELKPPPGSVHQGDERTSWRWRANRLLLKARISLERGEPSQTKRLITTVFKTLDEFEGSDDIRAQAFAVKAEAAIRDNQGLEAVRLAAEGLAFRVVDVTDKAWLVLVRAEGYLMAREYDMAREALRDWEAVKDSVENKRIKQRALSLADRLALQPRGFHIHPGNTDLNVKQWKLRVEEYLVMRESREFPNESKQARAKRLGIDTDTFNSILKRLEAVRQTGDGADESSS